MWKKYNTFILNLLVLVEVLRRDVFVHSFVPPSQTPRYLSFKNYLMSFQIPAFSKMSDNENADPSSGICPVSRYSMKYLRSRIPVSSNRKESSTTGFLTGFKINFDRLELEKKYKINVDEKSFYWVDSRASVEKKTSISINGIFSVYIIWKLLADMLNFASKESRENHSVVIVMPTSSLNILLQMTDIINWINNSKFDDIEDGSYRFSAEIDEESPLPTMILRCELVKQVHRDDNLKCHPIITYNATQVKLAMQRWVDRILVKMEICPFTKSTTKSGQGLSDVGVPVGRIAYHFSEAVPKKTSIPLLFSDTYEAIYGMIATGPAGKEGISSILLSAPGFDASFSTWAGVVFLILETTVSVAKAEPLIGIVCFHPQYKTPDGTTFPGFGNMHSVPRLKKWLTESNKDLANMLTEEDIAAGGAFQRRTPFATINVLRAEQLEAAEKKRSSTILYSKNIERLFMFGYDRLQKELEEDRLI